MDEAKDRSLAQRLMDRGIPKSHAYALANGTPKLAAAIRAYRRTGIKLGPIAEATDDEIVTLEKFGERADAPSDTQASAA